MLRFFFVFLLNLLSCLIWPFKALSRRRAAGPSGWLHLKLERAAAELATPVRWRFGMGPEPVVMQDCRRVLADAAGDARVRGLLVTLTAHAWRGVSAEAWRELLAQFRRSGKTLAVYLPDGAGTREYYLAACADRIFLGPDARLAALGFAVETPYLRRGLERAGLAFEVFARGNFKTAGESLVRDAMSDAQRQQVGELLDHLFDVVIEGVARGRDVSADVVRSWFSEGPFPAGAALTRRMVDQLAYEDEVKAALAPGLPEKSPLVSLHGYARRRRSPFRPWTKPPYLAVVPVHGTIVSEAVGPFPVADERSFAQRITQVRRDPRALGLLLHIDSRGGSALASARMLHEVRRCARDKPVVAYFANTAASGGYMIGVGAHEIVAESTSVTGSIGVVAARLVFESLLDRLGIRMELVKRGPRADMFSAAHFMDAATREAFQSELDEVYQRFIEQVAEGRRMSVAAVQPLAEGRVWSGARAQKHGLVDRLGTFDLALERLRERLGTPAARRAEPRLVTGKRRRLPQSPIGPLVAGWLSRTPHAGWAGLMALRADPRRDAVLAWAPYEVSWGEP